MYDMTMFCICVTWLTHTCVTFIHICVTRLVYILVITEFHSRSSEFATRVWYDDVLYMCDMYMCDMCMWDMTYSYVWLMCGRIHTCVSWLMYVWHDSYISLSSLSYTVAARDEFATRVSRDDVLYVCDMTHSYMGLICGRIHTCGSWLIYMWHDSYASLSSLRYTLEARDEFVTRVCREMYCRCCCVWLRMRGKVWLFISV